MPKWIDHIVVRVRDLDQSMRDYEQKLGLKPSTGADEMPHLGMKRALFPLGDSGNFIELAEPLGEDSALGRSLARHGEGLHLVALAVDDLAAATAEMKENGAKLIEAGTMVFVHPSDTHGILYQLIERP